MVGAYVFREIILNTIMKTVVKADKYFKISRLSVIDLKTFPRMGILKKISKMWIVKYAGPFVIPKYVARRNKTIGQNSDD